MKTGTLKKVLLWLIIAFVIVSIWQSPEGAAGVAGNFLGSVGNFFSAVIDRSARFIRNLGGGGSSPSTTTSSPA